MWAKGSADLLSKVCGFCAEEQLKRQNAKLTVLAVTLTFAFCALPFDLFLAF
jgi:hypothetical protein